MFNGIRHLLTWAAIAASPSYISEAEFNERVDILYDKTTNLLLKKNPDRILTIEEQKQLHKACTEKLKVSYEKRNIVVRIEDESTPPSQNNILYK